MSVKTDKVIITAEVAGRKISLEAFEVTLDERMDESIYQGMQRCGHQLQKEMLEVVDEHLQQTEAYNWENKGRKGRQLVTCNGWVKYKRRVYKDEEGNWRRPLDEMLELKPREHYTLSVKEKAGYLVSELAYRVSASVLDWLIGAAISHTTTGRLMKEVGQSLDAEDEEQLEQVFEQGEELEAGKQEAKVLYGESDGVWICLQGEEQKKTEVRVGIFYTGKKVIAEGRNRLENKVAVTKIVKNSQEWQETLLKTAYENYNLDSTTQLIVGGDGAKWVRQSFDLLGLPCEFVLDRYHLYRNARQAYGFTAQTGNWIHQITQEGIEAALPDMLHALSKAPPAKAKKMRQFIQYLIKNRDGLLDPDCRAHLKPGIQSLGAIEGNVDKLVVRRLKGRGRSWSLEGAKAMLAVCRHKDKLKQGAFKPFEKSPTEKHRKDKNAKEDKGEWLQTGVPSLYSSHQNRPWARTLRDKIHPAGVL
jgi:hypothetical protein